MNSGTWVYRELHGFGIDVFLRICERRNNRSIHMT